MKNQKLKLEELHVESFTTSEVAQIKGGDEVDVSPALSGVIVGLTISLAAC